MSEAEGEIQVLGQENKELDKKVRELRNENDGLIDWYQEIEKEN